MHFVLPGVPSSLRVLLAVLALAGAAPSPASQALPAKPVSRAPAGQPIDGLIVKLKPAPEQALALRPAAGRLEQALGAAKMTVQRLRPLGGDMHGLYFGRRLAPDEARRLAAALQAQPQVQWVVPNQRERRLALPTPNDPRFASGEQWWLEPVRGANGNVLDDRLRGVPGFQTAWAVSTGAPVVVAVLDTGITAEPELLGHVLAGYDFVADLASANDGDGRDPDASDPGDWVSQADIDGNPGEFGNCTVENSSWHGTNIAGLLAAATNNAAEVAAIDWSGVVLPVRVAGKCGAFPADIVAGIEWAAGRHVPGVPDNPNPARVINISFGGTAACDVDYQTAIDDAFAAGAVVVAAAGNERGALTRPASCRSVIAVGAVNRDGFKTNYSNFGSVPPNSLLLMTVGGDPPNDGRWGSILGDPGLLTLDNDGLTAPGNPALARLYGTSFSTPLVSGTIGLMLSVNPGLSAQQIFDGLRASARPHVGVPKFGACSASNPGRCACTTASCGVGLLDAAEALRYAQNPAGYTAPNWPLVVIDNADIDRAVALGPDEGSGVPSAPAPDTGGGALAPAWLLGLALAVIAAARCAVSAPPDRPRARSRSPRR